MNKDNNSSVPITQIHGHRGARGLLPENSLVGFKHALEVGCDAIELDICVSKDDELMVCHDLILCSDFVRNQNGQWIDSQIQLRALSYQELQQFDIGTIRPDSAYRQRFAKQAQLDNIRIPSLKDVVDMIDNEGYSTYYNIELKSAPYHQELIPTIEHYVDLVVSAIENLGIVNNVFVQSFDWRLPLAIQQKKPDIKIGLLTDMQAEGDHRTILADKPLLWTNNLCLKDFSSLPQMVKSAGADVWSCNYKDLTPELANEALELGLEVYVWTVNRPKAMQEMLDFGIHAITTDYPDRLFRLIESDDY